MAVGKWLMGAALAACLAACNPRDRPMPNLEDANATIKAGMTLSPWKDGSPDRSPDGKTQGELEADRSTFFRWYFRWAEGGFLKIVLFIQNAGMMHDKLQVF